MKKHLVDIFSSVTFLQRQVDASVVLAPLLLAIAIPAQAQTPAAASTSVTVDWSKIEMTSRTTPTLQVVVNPPLRRGSSIHDGAFAALHDLGADYVRYVPWLPYPRLAVVELEPPTPEKTSWNFTLIDPMTIDFFDATKGHPTILNFSTIPQWMFTTQTPVTYPANPEQPTWDYTQGTELRDPSMKELSGYYARLVSWYTQGGFTDENGQVHTSGYHYSIPYWEIFNEIEGEHHMTPQQYTARYDAVVQAIHAVSPETKFVGLALENPKEGLPRIEYFLDSKNHEPGIPLDMISYHFYASPKTGETADNWQLTFFAQAAGFLDTVHKVEEIRQRLSPTTQTTIDEVGVILPHDNDPGDPVKRIPPIYWNAAGALYAYLYVELSKIGIEVVGESQLVGYPTQFPSVSLIDWKNGKPNARYWVLKLLKDNFGPGDSLVATDSTSANVPDPDLEVQGYQTSSGRKLLLINKRNSPQVVNVPKEAEAATLDEVDLSTGENPPQSTTINGTAVTLAPFEVAVVHLAK
jgi:hypothetical protein